MGRQVRRILIGLAAVLVCLTGLLAVSALVPEVGCSSKQEQLRVTATRIYISSPTQVDAGHSFKITGTLERAKSPGKPLDPFGVGDGTADPFPQQQVTISTTSFTKTVITDENGKFSCQGMITTPGTYFIWARYDGDEALYYGTSANAQQITIYGQAPSVAPPNHLKPTNLLAIVIIIAVILVIVSGYFVYRRFLRDRLKKNTWKMPRWVPYVLMVLVAGGIFMSLPGRVIKFSGSPNREYEKTSRILTKTRLNIPIKVDPEVSFSFHGTLSKIENDIESPLPQQEIEIQVGLLNATGSISSIKQKITNISTDNEGKFAGDLVLEKPGRYQISAIFTKTGDLYLESGDSMNVMVGKVISSPFGSWKSPGWLSIIIGLPFLLFALGIGIMVFRHRRKASGKDKEAEVNEKVVIPSKLPSPPPTSIPVHAKAPPISIDLPQIASALPDVWGKDESLLIVFTVEGTSQVLAQYSLDIEFGADSTVRSPINQEGKAAQEHTFRKTGQYQIQAVLVKDVRNGYIPASRMVKIVDYREEIVRLYNEMVSSAKAQGLTLSTKMTAREVENRLRKAFPELSSEVTDSLTTVFEEANYSLHPITRPDYERMYRAVQEVEKQTLNNGGTSG